MRTIICLFTIVSIILGNYTANAQDDVSVSIRIEGPQNTLLESMILTRPKKITTVSGGTHMCDGTNNNASLIPGPTMTSTLDIASERDGFTWDATFYDLYDDFAITRIGDVSQTSSKFWGLLRNYQSLQVGGCQEKVIHGDDLLFAYDVYNKAHVLKLQASKSTIQVGDSITLTVTDGATGEPIEGAIVGNVLTNTFGRATLSFNNLGVQILKAERSDSIRSNGIMLTVIA